MLASLPPGSRVWQTNEAVVLGGDGGRRIEARGYCDRRVRLSSEKRYRKDPNSVYGHRRLRAKAYVDHDKMGSEKQQRRETKEGDASFI